MNSGEFGGVERDSSHARRSCSCDSFRSSLGKERIVLKRQPGAFVLPDDSTDDRVNIHQSAAKFRHLALRNFFASDDKDDAFVVVADRLDLSIHWRSISADPDQIHSNGRLWRNSLKHQSACRRVEHIFPVNSRIRFDRTAIDRNPHHERIFAFDSERIQVHSHQEQDAHNATD